VRVGDHERLLNTEADRVPRDLLCLVHDPKGTNHKRAHLPWRGHPEVIMDQPDGNTHVVMLVTLLLKRALHLGELLL
jgi:hypothetical protein